MANHHPSALCCRFRLLVPTSCQVKQPRQERQTPPDKTRQEAGTTQHRRCRSPGTRGLCLAQCLTVLPLPRCSVQLAQCLTCWQYMHNGGLCSSAAHTELTHTKHPAAFNAVRRPQLAGNINTLHKWMSNPDSDYLPYLRLHFLLHGKPPTLSLPLPCTDTGIRIHPLLDGNPFSIQRTDGWIDRPSTTHRSRRKIGPQHLYCYVRDAGSGSDRK